MLNSSRVLVVAPHADDESIGCGATLLKYKDGLESLTVVLVSASDTLHREGKMVDKSVRHDEFSMACSMLDAGSVYLPYESRTLFQHLDQLVKSLDEVVDRTEPDTIFMPCPTYHQDHRTVFEAMYSVLRPGRHPSVDRVLIYETGECEWYPGRAFTPNVYVALSEKELEAKLQLIGVYKSQARVGAADPQFVEKYARVRGLDVNEELAEAFEVARYVVR